MGKEELFGAIQYTNANETYEQQQKCLCKIFVVCAITYTMSGTAVL